MLFITLGCGKVEVAVYNSDALYMLLLHDSTHVEKKKATYLPTCPFFRKYFGGVFKPLVHIESSLRLLLDVEQWHNAAQGPAADLVLSIDVLWDS